MLRGENHTYLPRLQRRTLRVWVGNYPVLGSAAIPPVGASQETAGQELLALQRRYLAVSVGARSSASDRRRGCSLGPVCVGVPPDSGLLLATISSSKPATLLPRCPGLQLL